jgi:hypothetical protein
MTEQLTTQQQKIEDTEAEETMNGLRWKCSSTASEGKRTLLIASLRYYDVFAKVEGKWLFAERKIMVDWTDTRPINV